jgi:hypothetical protein
VQIRQMPSPGEGHNKILAAPERVVLLSFERGRLALYLFFFQRSIVCLQFWNALLVPLWLGQAGVGSEVGGAAQHRDERGGAWSHCGP